MCRVHYQQHPVCYCVGISGVVGLCTLFRHLPENKGKRSFRSKVLTSHCKGLNVCFNGVDYVSDDVEGGDGDLMPKGLDCPDLDLSDEGDDPGPCALCDNEEVLKFLKAKGIEYSFDEEAGEGGKAAEQGEGEKAAGEAGEESKGKSADRAEGSPSGVEGAGQEWGPAQKMMEWRKNRAAGRRARSGLAQSMSASKE